MARWNDLPWREDVYKAAELWKTRCLLNDGALTGDPNIWTAENLGEVQERIVHKADWGERNFWQKLQSQLTGAKPGIFHLMSEIMWLVYLFPLGQQAGSVPPTLKAKNKLRDISIIRGWGELSQPAGEAFTTNALSGIGDARGFYIRRRFHALRYLLQILTEFKKLSKSDQIELLNFDNNWGFAQWSEQFRQETQVPMRHALLFFLFPDHFERMVSISKKQKLLMTFSHHLTPIQSEIFQNDGGYETHLALDKAIFAVRQVLENECRTSDVDFYQPHIHEIWARD